MSSAVPLAAAAESERIAHLSPPPPSFEPKDPAFAARVRGSFARQPLMETLGAHVGHVAPGYFEVILPVAAHILQQHGFVHGGVVACICDSACGYAAMSLYPQTAAPLTAEYKINFLNPARGERLIASGVVIRPGRTLNVVDGTVEADVDGKRTLVAKALMTMMRMEGMSDERAGAAQ